MRNQRRSEYGGIRGHAEHEDVRHTRAELLWDGKQDGDVHPGANGYQKMGPRRVMSHNFVCVREVKSIVHARTHDEGVTPLLADGQHLPFMATVCGIEEIPVLVFVCHRE